VLYGCETWSLILREEHRLKVFVNKVLKRIFGPEKDEILGGWRILHNERHKFFSSPNIIRMIKPKKIIWKGHVARIGRRGMHLQIWWESEKERDH
jgi:hypothetical protein